MMKPRLTAVLIQAMLSAQFAAAASAVSLEDLEARLQHSPAVALSELEYRQRSAAVEEEQAKQGWKLYGSASLNDNDEIYAQGLTRSYREVSGQIGLQYPLLGSRLREKEAIQDASARRNTQAADVELARINALLDLRKAYIGYWASQRSMELATAYVEAEGAVRARLAQRVNAGLLLKADYDHLLTGYSYANSQKAEFSGRADSYLRKIRLLTQGSIETFRAAAPSLPPLCDSPQALDAAVTGSHPELVALDKLIEEKAGNPRLDSTYAIDSNMQLSYAANRETSSGETGHSAMIGISVKMPLAFLRTGSSAKDQAKAELEKTKLKRELREQELRLEAMETQNHYQALQDARRHAREKVAAARNATNTQLLRVRSLPEAQIEDFENSRRQALEAELLAIQAEAAMLEMAAQLHAIAPFGCNGAEPVGPERNAPVHGKRVAATHGPIVSPQADRPLQLSADDAGFPSILDLTAMSPSTDNAHRQASAGTSRAATMPINPAFASSSTTLLKRGATGERVVKLQTLQNRLFNAGVPTDGQFGIGTLRALREAQRRIGESPDGVLGPQTERNLLALAERRANGHRRPMQARQKQGKDQQSGASARSASAAANDLTKRGARGEEVVKLQQALNELFDARIPVDGQFGNSTVQALKNAQKHLGETPDGVYGPGTEEKLAALAVSVKDNKARPDMEDAQSPTVAIESRQNEIGSRNMGWIEQ